ncbi:glycoside hydrolase family 95 protein [Paenibacillus glycanilyticus]|uniref:glycoside hydrolase family 95 protein n=1 Tax=Paenibacillus glycanilyticus TaxID=126569 RepID=UPI00203C4BA0|nr:glycoside hydrolase family 95 protein [Paenibacillus glycanilyticus]MCM3626055.1 glycoside hydrolase family 95 protein [Paenibacillus glycanilyticus]
MKLQYNQASKKWTDALPTGNGRLGAMMFGGAETERIQLNEDTLWSGGPRNADNDSAIKILPQVRQLIEEGKYVEADQLSKRMMGPYTQSYMPMADLYVKFLHGNIVRDYRRSLHLEDGISAVEYRIGSVTFTRRMFVSYPDQVVVLRLEASSPGQLNFHARLESPLRYETLCDENGLILKGDAPEQVDPSYYDTDEPLIYGEPGDAMRFEGRLTANLEGGHAKYGQDGLRVSGANAVTLIFSAATSFNGYDRSPGREGKNESAEASAYLEKVMKLSYSDLLQRHVDDHQQLFNRVELNLGESIAPPEHPTDARIRDYGASDPGLVELLYHYGRYLMIASSRKGTQPANLQGIWNEETRPPWSSNWTLNINAEMNYWPAETCNLAECHTPLLDFIERLSRNGQKTAATNYGARGWTAHHNSDIWCQSSPVGAYGHGEAIWTLWPMGGVWLCQHLWEHYAFGNDQTFLREQAYPIMKDAALFCLDWLHEDKEGRLITSPSTSPEHKFRTPEGLAGVSMASTMDISLIWDLFTNLIEASDILGVDEAFRDTLTDARSRLFPMQIASNGRLQEWALDFEDEDPLHRHVSHLFGVYPGRQLTWRETPELMAAAERALDLRGDGGTGWSLGWKVGLWARFGNGNRAFGLLSNLLTLVDGEKENYHHGGGVYTNLFDAHPPFQIDGNFAATSGIAELLLQSHQGFIHLLPALPDAWPKGFIKGLRARGHFDVSLQWEEGAVLAAEITSRSGGTCRVHSAVPLQVESDGVKLAVNPDVDGMVTFATIQGGRYELRRI